MRSHFLQNQFLRPYVFNETPNCDYSWVSQVIVAVIQGSYIQEALGKYVLKLGRLPRGLRSNFNLACPGSMTIYSCVMRFNSCTTALAAGES